jgi:hypothetical protein
MGLAQEQAAGVTDAEQNIWNCHSVSFTTVFEDMKFAKG